MANCMSTTWPRLDVDVLELSRPESLRLVVFSDTRQCSC
jgi:hypothetical protein